MCGIIGIVSNDLKRNINWIKNNLNKISHRGPDNIGIWNSKDQLVCFGHTRLSIIDLSFENNQPFIDKENKISLVFNGEIYNYLELKKELESLGYNFKTNGDTEVLLKSYIHWKEHCFKKIQGMFAFSICDEKKKKIYLVRDQYGQKPLYYKHVNNTLKFASELQIFLDDEDTKLNEESVNEYLYFGFVKNSSLIKNINQLNPGKYLELNYDRNTTTIHSHWDIPESPQVSNFNDFEIIDLLKKSLKKQLRSDVSTGFLLSGGVDSSLLVSLASEISLKKIHTYNVSYKDNESKIENQNAKLISKKYKTEHYNLVIDKFDVFDFLEILKKFGEPINDSSIIPTYCIYNQIKGACKVIIGGDGGDEIFGGYKHFQNFLIYNSLNFFSKSTNKFFLKFFNNKILKNKVGSMYFDLFKSENNIIDIPNYFNNEERYNIFKNQELFHKINLDKRINKNDKDVVIDSMKNSFNNYLPKDIMFKIDRCSMLNSLEARAPYLDKELVTYIFKNTVGNDHVSFFARRKLQKKISKTLLPKTILNQKKRGFSFNFNFQLKDKIWKNEIYTVLKSKDCLFSEKYINYLFKMHERGFKVSEKIFGLLFFEIWRKKYRI